MGKRKEYLRISGLKNKKIVANKDLKMGTLVVDLKKATKQPKDKYTIEWKNNNYYDSIGKFINHSFKPNCVLSKHTGEMVTIKPVKRDEQLTFDYTITESYISNPFIDKETGLLVGKFDIFKLIEECGELVDQGIKSITKPKNYSIEELAKEMADVSVHIKIMLQKYPDLKKPFTKNFKKKMKKYGMERVSEGSV